MMPPLDIISFGAATVDIFAKSQEFIIGNNLLSLPYSSKGEISQSLICSGGGATNSSVSFARLGLKSACVALTGQDPLSQYILKDLSDNLVSLELLVSKKSETTDFSIILVASDGGRSILTNRGDSGLTEKHLNWKKLGLPQWFYITSLEGNLNLLEQLIGYAKENHIKVALNPGNRELSQKRRLIPLLPHVDFLLLNKTESEMLTAISITDDHFWTKLASYHSRVTAVTNGRDGAYILSGGNTFYSPIINTSPVDETGAGDSFGSAFVAALIHGRSPEQALFWGIKNSASVVSFLGAKSGLLTLDQFPS